MIATILLAFAVWLVGIVLVCRFFAVSNPENFKKEDR
jgi:hypothetical protein